MKMNCSSAARRFLVLIGWALLLTCPAAALTADWSDDHFSCDLTVTSTGGDDLGYFLNPFAWGTWKKIEARFYVTKEPRTSTVFSCHRSGTSNQYSCSAGACPFNYHFMQFSNNVSIDLYLNPGVGKSDACKLIFDNARIKWPDYYRL